MAVQLEHRYSKRTILERYLNTIYFGNGAYGVQAAARRYFAKDAADLDLAQSALLAGLIRAPETLQPVRRTRPRRWPGATRCSTGSRTSTGRRRPRSPRRARRSRSALAPPADGRPLPRPVLRRAGDEAHPGQQGVRRDRGPAPAAAPRRRPPHPHDPRPEAAGARRAVRRPGDLAARDRSGGRARRRSTRRPGRSRPTSAARTSGAPQPWAKVDLADIDCYERRQGLPPGREHVQAVRARRRARGRGPALPDLQRAGLPDDPAAGRPAAVARQQLRRHRPRADEPHRGDRQLRQHGLRPARHGRRSRSPSSTSRRRWASAHRRPPVPSAALGSNGATVLDMASAYDSLAGDGMHTDPVFVTRVTTSDGTVLYEAPIQRTRVLPETTARTINGVLQQVVTRGTGVNARIGRPVAGKTGTSDNWADAWFVGYTPELVTAVWVGFPDAGAGDAAADDAHHRHRRVVARADLAAVRRAARSPRRPIDRVPALRTRRHRRRPRRSARRRQPHSAARRGRDVGWPMPPERCATRATGSGCGPVPSRQLPARDGDRAGPGRGRAGATRA